MVQKSHHPNYHGRFARLDDMPTFEIGLLSFLFAFMAAALYQLSYWTRMVVAWFKNAEKPKERVVPITLVSAVVGFAFGCFAQPRWADFEDCRQAGKAPFTCALQTP